MTAVFTVDELAAYPGVVASPESIALVTELINELVEETQATHGVGTIENPAQVRRLALAAAARPLTNPEGASTISIQIDDYKETRVFPDGSVVKGSSGIGFTPEEMGRLVTALTGQSPDRKSIKLMVPGFTDVECPVSGWLPA